MKVPMRYQVTECDCGPTTILNGISYLLEREDIPPETVKNIYLYSMDNFRSDGSGITGTTHESLRHITNWIDRLGKTGRIDVTARYISEQEVNLDPDGSIAETLRNGGVAIARIDLDGSHFILLTGLDDEWVYLFDPYMLDEPFPVPGVKVVHDRMYEYNRIVPRASFTTEDVHPYSFGPYGTREAMLLMKKEPAEEDESGKKP